MVTGGSVGSGSSVSRHWYGNSSRRRRYDRFDEGNLGSTMIKIEKLQKLMKHVEARRGRFTFFAVFMREESPGLWDLVVSAPWLKAGRLKALGEFVEEMSEALGQDEVMSFSRIVTL